VAVNERNGIVVAALGRWETILGDDAGAAGVKHREGDPVAVGIDADDMINEFCEHGQWNLSVSVSVGASLGGTATPGL